MTQGLSQCPSDRMSFTDISSPCPPKPKGGDVDQTRRVLRLQWVCVTAEQPQG